MPPPDKNSLRNLFLARRQAIGLGNHTHKSQTCVRHLLTMLESSPAFAVCAGYFPVKHEVDILHALAALAAQGHAIALPRAVKGQKELLFYRWQEGDALTPDMHGIKAPEVTTEALTPDILIVPLVAFDRSGHRLGYGGGYYDATLAALRRMKPLLAIGAAFAMQEAEPWGFEPHDERLDFIVTEEEIIAAS